MVTVNGLLRKPESKLWYGPETEPENNNWYYSIDLAGMASAQNLVDVYPMFLFASSEEDDNRLPVAGRTEINIVNNAFGLCSYLVWAGCCFTCHLCYCSS